MQNLISFGDQLASEVNRFKSDVPWEATGTSLLGVCDSLENIACLLGLEVYERILLSDPNFVEEEIQVPDDPENDEVWRARIAEQTYLMMMF